MAHSYVSNLLDYVFNTKERRKIITPDLQERLWPCLGALLGKSDESLGYLHLPLSGQ